MGYLVATKEGLQGNSTAEQWKNYSEAHKGDSTAGNVAGFVWEWVAGIPGRMLERLEDPSKRVPNGPENALNAGLAIAGGMAAGTRLPCSKCFVAGTQIYTKRGLVPIEKVKVGDWVAARSDETSETAYKQVVRLVRNGEKEIIRLRYRLPNGKAEVLGVTEEHPFMLEGRRWVNAGLLKPGDKIMRLAGGVLTVVSMRQQVIKQHTFNFEVDEFHTYFAGIGGAWVHNAGPCNYENPGHHDPSGGPNRYNSSKSVLPKNHDKLWSESRLSETDGHRYTKVGNGSKAEYHRFVDDSNGNWHWNGSTVGKTASGQARAISMDNIPNEVKKW